MTDLSDISTLFTSDFRGNSVQDLLDQALEAISSEGLEGLGKAVKILINASMKLEREKYLQAKPYERSETRQSQANGYKPRTVKSRIGALELSIPKTRDGQFYPQSLEKGLRSERALKLSLAQMYIEGVSTRKVAKITEELCGFEVSSSQVSKAAQLLDEELETWRNRPLGLCSYVYLDARYEKVRVDKSVIDCAVLWAIGVDPTGRRKVLGVSLSLSEAEVHWRQFLQSLSQRGLHGVELFTSDSHAGLKAALRSVFPGVKWQRCQFHLQQNAQAYISCRSKRKQVAADIRSILDAPNRIEAMRLLNITVEKYQDSMPRLSTWMEENIPESFTVFDFPSSHRKRLRTSNNIERLSKEIKKRTSVVKIFPNEDSCLRLITALLIEVSEEWENSPKPYMPSEAD